MSICGQQEPDNKNTGLDSERRFPLPVFILGSAVS
jgi:hypothetical protein